MPDTKITALAAITTVDPAADVLPIVDISDTSMAASGTTKKITSNQILGAGGTATLASATITGDLTVHTSTLKVDSANNRVIVGHTSGSSAFQVTNAGAAGIEIQPTGFSSAPLILSYNRSAPAYTQLTLDGSTIVHALSGSTAMTLNANGLGIGVTPSAWDSGFQAIENSGGSLWSGSNGAVRFSQNVYYATGLKYKNALAASQYVQTSGQHQWFYAPSGTAGTAITFTQAMTLDTSGNLLVGTTSMPSGVTFARLVAKSTSGDWSGVIWNSNATPYGFRIQHDTDSNGTGNEFLYCLGGANLRASIRSNGGIANYQANDVSLSDSRLKTDIKPLASYWNKIKSLELVTFKYKDQTHSDDNIGLIAQQVESVAPELVDVDGFGETPDDGVPLKTIYTTDLYHAAIKALQEAMTRIEALESKLA